MPKLILFFALSTFGINSKAKTKEKEPTPVSIECDSLSDILATNKKDFKTTSVPTSTMKIKYLIVGSKIWLAGNLGKEKLTVVNNAQETIQSLEQTPTGNINLHSLHFLNKGNSIFATIQKSYISFEEISAVSIHFKCRKEY